MKNAATRQILAQGGKVTGIEYEDRASGEVRRNEQAGIYACGDVTTVPYKQIVIAMGEGSKAALSAFDYLL